MKRLALTLAQLPRVVLAQAKPHAVAIRSVTANTPPEGDAPAGYPTTMNAAEAAQQE